MSKSKVVCLRVSDLVYDEICQISTVNDWSIAHAASYLISLGLQRTPSKEDDSLFTDPKNTFCDQCGYEVTDDD